MSGEKIHNSSVSSDSSVDSSAGTLKSALETFCTNFELVFIINRPESKQDYTFYAGDLQDVIEWINSQLFLIRVVSGVGLPKLVITDLCLDVKNKLMAVYFSHCKSVYQRLCFVLNVAEIDGLKEEDLDNIWHLLPITD